MTTNDPQNSIYERVQASVTLLFQHSLLRKQQQRGDHVKFRNVNAKGKAFGPMITACSY